MKRYSFPFVLALTVVAAGCGDSILEVQPKDALAEANFWETEKDLNAAVNGTYAAMLSSRDTYSFFGGQDCLTSMCFFRDGSRLQTALGNHDERNGWIRAWWRDSYRGIVRANDVLAHVDEMNVDEAVKQERKGEALFLRAWYYFNLVYHFGDVPLVTGVPTLADAQMARAPKAEVVAQILADLTQAAELLPRRSDEQKGRAGLGAALFLKAKTLMMEQRYDDALAPLQELMGMGYALFPDYTTLFARENEHNSEVIWDLEATSGTGLGQGNVFDKLYANRLNGPTGIGGWAWVQPQIDLVEMHELVGPAVPGDPYANRDPRMAFNILYPRSTFLSWNGDIVEVSPDGMGGNYNHSKTGMFARKFVTSGPNDYNNWDSEQNWIFFRYADVLLMYAEAKIETGQIDQSVYDAINAVRARVDAPLIQAGKTQAELREIVRRERAVELALEGWHFFDALRWGTLADEVAGNEVINVWTGDVKYTRIFERGKHELWPIPGTEIDNNPNLTQNPGW